MKPYTIERLKDGTAFLGMQLEGLPRSELCARVEGRYVEAVAIPIRQTWGRAYFLQVFLDSGEVLEITSSSTETEGWEEVGTINVAVVKRDQVAEFDSTYVRPNMWLIEEVQVLCARAANVVAEAGVVLRSKLDGDVVVAAGETPGVLTIKAGFLESEFEPQFDESAYESAPMALSRRC